MAVLKRCITIQVGNIKIADRILCKVTQAGIYIIVTADLKLRARGSKFLEMLVDSNEGLVLGSIRDQSIFSYTGIREDNRLVDIGYYNFRGENQKVKIIEYA